jgi:hypothetical protein
MKKVYIPTEEDLHDLENFGVNTYYYLITKTIESLVMADVIYEEEDMLDMAYEEFSDFPQIIYALAKMYPEKIIESDRASRDVELCKKIIPTFAQNDKSVYGLDQMQNFKEEILQNPEVMESIIKTLAIQLPKSPRYRFEYQGPNDTLDQIFACETNTENMDSNTLKILATLEPMYFIKNKKGIILPDVAANAITQYANLYGVKAYGVRFNDLTSLANNNERKNRLIRRLNIHKQYYRL